jgi:hypothetical protein
MDAIEAFDISDVLGSPFEDSERLLVASGGTSEGQKVLNVGCKM